MVTDYLLEERSIKDTFFFVALNKLIDSFFGDELIMGSFVSRLLPMVIGISFLMKFKNQNIIATLILITSSKLVNKN